MPLIPGEALPYFENMIYLPMIIKILEADGEVIKNGPFKLKNPYLRLIEGALESVRDEQKQTNIHMKRSNMRIVKGSNDGTFTEYKFIYKGHEDKRRYLNVRLRNRTEELINIYFTKTENPNLKG
jgi:hypothetical protein